MFECLEICIGKKNIKNVGAMNRYLLAHSYMMIVENLISKVKGQGQGHVGRGGRGLKSLQILFHCSPFSLRVEGLPDIRKNQIGSSSILRKGSLNVGRCT